MAFSFTEPMGIDLENLYLGFNENFQNLIIKLNLFVQQVNTTPSFKDNQEIRNKIYLIDSRREELSKICSNYFNENKKYLSYIIVGKSFLSYMEDVDKSLKQISSEITLQEVDKVLNSVQELHQAFNTINIIAENEKSSKKLIYNLEEQVKKATETVKSVISAKEALESKPTEEIYSKAAKKYINTARFYDGLLLGTLGVFYYITSNFFENFQMISIFKAIQKSSSEAQTLAIFFFITKLTLVSIVITLATIFIRRSSHFRKLHDQANQTSLELNALPNYLRQVDGEHHSEIYKEMIPKFFGKELDQSQNDKVGDLVKDQLAAGTELIKASAEMAKSLKAANTSNEKPKKSESVE